MQQREAKRVESNLLVQEDVFERSYLSILTGLKHIDSKFQNSLKIIHSQKEADRRRESQKLQKSLLAIVLVIQKLRQNIKDEQYLEEHDIELFKSHLISIEEKITTFRSLLTEQLGALQQNEQELQQAMDSFRHFKLESSGKLIHNDNASVAPITKLQIQPRVQSHICEEFHPDIQGFQMFLQNRGGHSGGWDVNDHLLFIRLLQKYRGSNQMTTALLDLMPDKTAEEIAEHESWYHDYLTLKEAHRKAIHEWREKQRVAKHNSMSRELEKTENIESSETRAKQSVIKRDPQIKEKIKKWKQMQEEKQREEVERLQKQKREERDRWKRKDQQRKLLVARKQQQDNAKEARAQLNIQELQCLQEVQKQVKEARIPLKDFWEQDRQFVQRRRAARLQHYNKFNRPPRSSSCSSSNSKIQVERDPARLLQHTTIWKAHIKRSSSSENNRESPSPARLLYIADIPHLAVPKWREGMV